MARNNAIPIAIFGIPFAVLVVYYLLTSILGMLLVASVMCGLVMENRHGLDFQQILRDGRTRLQVILRVAN